MAPLRQTSFASGELAPSLYGRTDLELFGHGARQLLNFVVNRQGNAITRPGTALAWTAKVPDVVLVPYFPPGALNGYVLEFGDQYVRVYQANTLALVIELVTPFRTADLPALQWAQSGFLLTLTHQSRAPQEIDFSVPVPTIFPVRYGPLGDNPGDPSLQAVMPSIGGSPPAMPVLVAWQPLTLFVVDAAHPPREWQYKVSTIVRNILTGEKFETLPRDITDYSQGDQSTGSVAAGPILALPADNLLILFPDAPVYIAPGYGAGVAAPANWVCEEYVYYRGRGRLFGLVGSTRNNASFADFGDEPNYLTPPLRGDSPFRAGEFPAAVAFFQQRRAFAGTALRGSSWWASAVDQFANFDKPVLNWSGQPLEATLLGRKKESVVTMVQLEHLFVFTDTSVWQVGRNDVPLDFDTLPSVSRPIDEVGARAMQPLVMGDAIVFAEAMGRAVRALSSAGDQSGTFRGRDISWHAEHLFAGAHQTPTAAMESNHIVSWCFQRKPWGVGWAVRADGTLISLSRTGADSWAWTRHDTGSDQVVSVTAVPRLQLGVDGALDDLFLAVKRGGTTRIERMTALDVRGQPKYVTDPKYSGNPIGSEQFQYPVDSSVVATVTKATGTAVAGLGHLEGREVWASCPGIDPQGPLRVTGGQVTTPAGWGPTGAVTFKAAFGLPYTCDLELLDAAPGRTNQRAIVSVGFEIDGGVGFYVGEDFNHLVEWRQRAVSDSYEFPSAATLFAVVLVKGAWRKTGRSVLRQSKPLPLTVLGITRELEEGGR